MNSPTETEIVFNKLPFVVTDMSNESFFVGIKLFEVSGIWREGWKEMTTFSHYSDALFEDDIGRRFYRVTHLPYF